MFPNILALAATLTISTVHASSHVYASFYAQEGALLPNFDVANPGCFSLDHAISVSFSQMSGKSVYDGPYCLSAWHDGDCPGFAADKQEFVRVYTGEKYKLQQGVSLQGSYRWAPHAC